jgi:hypothetical protein
MDVIRQTVEVQDDASSTIERIEQAWASYNQTVAAGADPAEALDAAFQGVISTQEGLVPNLEQIKSLMSDLNIQTASTAAAQDTAAASLSDLSTIASDAAEGIYAVDSASASASNAIEDMDASASAASDGLSTVDSTLGAVSDRAVEAGNSTEDLGGTFQNMSQLAQGNIASLLDAMDEIGPTAVGIGAVLTILPGIIEKITDSLNDMIDAAAGDQTTSTRLESTLRANIANYEQYDGALQAAIEHGRMLAYSDDQVRDALSRTIPVTKDVAQAIQVVNAAEDLASANGMDLATAAMRVSVAMETGGAGLQRYGIIVEKGATATQVLAQIQAQYTGQAAAQADTAAGAAQRWADAQSEAMETAGRDMATFQQKVDTVSAALLDQRTAAIEAGDAVTAASANAALSALQDPITAHFMDMTGQLDAMVTQVQEAEGTFADSFDSMSSNATNNMSYVEDYIRSSTNAWTEALAEGEVYAADTTSTQMQAIKDYMNIAGVTGPEGEAAGAEYWRLLEAGEIDAVNGTNAHVSEIIAAVNLGLAAVNQLRNAAAGFQNGVGGLGTVSNAAANAAFAGVAAQNANNADVGNSDALKRSQYAPTVYPTVGYDQDGKQVHGKNTDDVWTLLDGSKGPAQLAWERAQKDAARGAKSAASDANKAEQAAKALAAAQEQATAELQAIADKNALAAATDLVDIAQGKLNQDTALATATTKALGDQMDALKAQASNAMQTAEDGVQGAQDALDALRATHHDVLEGMDDQIYAYNQNLLQTQKNEEALIEPLQRVADAAQKALDDINDATAQQDRLYQHQKEALEDSAYAAEQTAKAIMGPLNAAYDTATAAVNAQQEAVSALSDEYANKLLPVQERLTELQQQQQADDRAKTIGDEAQSVANLSARLAAAVPGSLEAIALQKQLAEARKKLGQDEEIDTLTTKKEGIEAERDKALKAANDQLKVLQEQQKIAQENRDNEQKLIDAQKAESDARMQALDKEQELYDRQQRDKAQAAQDAKATADANLKAEQDNSAAMQKAIQDEIDKVRERETVYQHAAQKQEEAQQALVAGAQANATAIKNVYDGMEADLTARTKSIQDYLTGLKDADTANVDSAKADKQALQDSIDARKDAAALAKAMADSEKAFGDSTQTANDRLKDMTPLLQDVAPAMTSAGNAIKNDLAPAVQTLPTTVAAPLGDTAQTFLDYFGSETQSTDLSKNLPWAINGHNKEGFVARIDEYFTLGMGIDGWKGTMELRMKEFHDDFIGILDGTATDAKVSANGVGNAIIDGIEAPLADPNNRTALGTAIADAVKAAMAEAQKQLEIASPSKLAGRMLGEPIPDGIASGVANRGHVVGSALDSVLMGALSGAQNGYPYGGAGSLPVGGYGAMGAGAMYMQADVTVVLPNVTDTRKMSRDPNDYGDATIAILQRTFYDTTRRGQPTQRKTTTVGDRG